MIYMTGWITERYWDYYMYTRDREFLAKRGYPMIKDCALFYLDFLKKAPHRKLPPQLKDSKYHVFPSVQGESGFKDAMDLCDKPQGVKHVRHALWCAIEASKTLDVDEDLRRDWQDRLDNLVGSDELAKLTPYERHCKICGPQGGEGGEPWKPVEKRQGVKPWERRSHTRPSSSPTYALTHSSSLAWDSILSGRRESSAMPNISFGSNLGFPAYVQQAATAAMAKMHVFFMSFLIVFSVLRNQSASLGKQDCDGQSHIGAKGPGKVLAGEHRVRA